MKDEPAFPRSYSHDGHNGMTLRDYFAGQAFPVLATELYAHSRRIGNTYENSVFDMAAESAYEAADAMLKARLDHSEESPW